MFQVIPRSGANVVYGGQPMPCLALPIRYVECAFNGDLDKGRITLLGKEKNEFA